MCLCQNKFVGSQNFQRGLQVDIFPHLVGSCNQQSISVGSYRIIMKKKNTLLSFFVFLLSVPMREVTFTAILADFMSFLRDYSDQLISNLASKLPEHNNINRVIENLESPLFSKKKLLFMNLLHENSV